MIWVSFLGPLYGAGIFFAADGVQGGIFGYNFSDKTIDFRWGRYLRAFVLFVC